MTGYSLSDFDGVPSAKELVADKVNLAALPTIEKVKAEARWTTSMVELFERDQAYFAEFEDGKKRDRSAAMARLAYSGAEMGWTDEQIAAVLYDADDRWGKYTARRTETRNNILLNFVNRAREKHGYTQIETSSILKNLMKDPAAPVEAGQEPMIWGFKEFVEADIHVDWMLEGLLAKEGIGLIVATPGVGKTQFTIGMAAQLALGYDSFLKWPNLVGSRKVLFLSLEMGKAPLHHFMVTIAGGYQDLNTLDRNLKVFPFGRPVPFDTPQGQAFLDSVLEEVMPDLIVIDSLQRSISKEMTDELAAKNLMHYLAVTRAKYRCAVVMVHHNRKKPNEAAAKKASADQSDVYGSVFFSADVDFILSLTKLNDSLLRVDTLKNRLGREEQSFEIARDQYLGFTMNFGNLQKQFGTQDDNDRRTTLDV